MTQPTAPTTPAGRVEIEGERASLHFERFYPHPPEAVWAALTEPEQLAAWFMTEATIDAREGGSVAMVSGPARFQWTGRILTWDPPKAYAYEWKLAPRPEVPQGEDSVVSWTLRPEPGGTRLTLSHTRLTKGTALGFAPGTHAFLDRLEAQLAGEPLPGWMHRYEAVKGAYPAWSR